MTRGVVLRRTLPPLALFLAGLWLAAAGARAALPIGGLTQLPGTLGCFTFNGASEDGAGTCSIARGLVEGESAVLSPDGKNLYEGSYPNNTSSLPPSYTAFSRSTTTGVLTQLSGTAGCFTPDGSSGGGPATCTEARGLQTEPGDGRDIAFTPDGLQAYVAVANTTPTPTGDILIFRRDPGTGALTQLAGAAGCISSDGSSQDGAGTCQTDSTLSEPTGVTLSSDNRFLYVTDFGTTNRIHVFSRDVFGNLTEIQCLSEAPAPVGCATGRVLGNSQSVVLSPDGTHAYSGSFFHGVSVFDRDPNTGLLVQKAGTAGCITDDGKDDAGNATCDVGRVLKGAYGVVLSKDGHTLYQPASLNNGLAVFHVNADGSLTQLSGANGCFTDDGKDNTGTATCTAGRELNEPYGSTISPDGRTLYVSDSTTPWGGVAIFSLDPTTGVPAQLPGLPGCWSSDGSSDGTAGLCMNGRALSEGWGISVSPDGAYLYQATDDTTNAGLAIFARENGPACRATSVAVPHGKPTPVTLSCSDSDGDPVVRSIVSNPSHGTLGAVKDAAGTVTYTPGTNYSGPDSFTFAASDSVNRSATATATITVAGVAFRGATLSSRSLTASARGILTIKVGCPAGTPGGRCSDLAALYSSTGALPASAARKKRKAAFLGSVRFSVPAGKTVTKRVHMNKAGRKLLKAHRRFKARLRLTSRASGSQAVTHVYSVTIRRKR